jgi:hypothetical protein
MNSSSSASASATAIAPAASAPAPAAAARRPGWQWRWAAFFLSGAGQVVTISSLQWIGAPSATWAALLLATAPVLLGVLIAFGRVPVARLAAVVSAVAIIAGIAGDWRIGLLFVPALIAVLGAGFALWRQPS